MHPEDQGRLQPLWPRFEGEAIGPPVTLDLELTDVCTHRCPWCIYPRQPSYLPFEAAQVAFADAVTLGTDSIIVSGGGEPLLHPQAEAILALGAEHDVGVTLFSNGEALGQHADVIGASCDYVRLSLDAGTARTHARLHGTDEAIFERIFAAVADLADRTQIGGSAVVTNQNVDEIGLLAQRLAAAGARLLLLKFDVRRSIEWNAKLARRLEPQLEIARAVLDAIDLEDPTQVFVEVPLGLASAKSSVQPDGGLYPCCHHRDGALKIADVVTEGIAAVWGGERHREVLERYRTDVHPCRLMRYWINRPPERAGTLSGTFL
jgi:MoaA/NifB/PqqE/SkfB family radical SAM enzyme